MPRLTSLLADWAALNAARGPEEGEVEVQGQPLAEALLRACQPLSDEVLRSLPATPEDAAVALADAPFADRVEGAYLPFEWLESFCAATRLPLADIDAGWDVSDGEDVYLCPRVMLADDPDSPQDERPFVRVDQVQRWTRPE